MDGLLAALCVGLQRADARVPLNEAASVSTPLVAVANDYPT